MDLLAIPVRTAQGEQRPLGEVLGGRGALVVNVASRCGLTPQYEALQTLHDQHAADGFTVLAFPCNQFGGQEPGAVDEIVEFCSTQYGVTFPVLDKVEVNGPGQHPLWQALTQVPDDTGEAGEVQWNFEKFVVSADGRSVSRFRPPEDPLSDAVDAAVAGIGRVTAEPVWTETTVEHVRVGDRVRLSSGAELAVSRVDRPFFGQDGMVKLVEVTEDSWRACAAAVTMSAHVLRSH